MTNTHSPPPGGERVEVSMASAQTILRAYVETPAARTDAADEAFGDMLRDLYYAGSAPFLSDEKGAVEP